MAASIGNGIANANADSNANIQMNKRTPYTHTSFINTQIEIQL